MSDHNHYDPRMWPELENRLCYLENRIRDLEMQLQQSARLGPNTTVLSTPQQDALIQQIIATCDPKAPHNRYRQS